MHRPLPIILLGASLGLATLTGCSNEPELNNRLTPELRAAAYPPLRPIDDLIAPQAAPEDAAEQLQKTLKARSARLDRRAEALRRASQ
ncbi:hypothetical protein [Pseudophaeobacter flagellatus]|uniref:hypothetical protein n=1 Tax=Pseudophaeobacter flagellatus TaxID=2899119 RepID=UPI001E5DBAB9|nr:hypothetical protein [Pseudophaeobacter flagellatus]MCD9148625.1 hypothetical protein [Pseudophaeobacter flagellatus]